MNAARPWLPGLSLWYLLVISPDILLVVSRCQSSLCLSFFTGLWGHPGLISGMQSKRERKRGWNLVEANEASLTVANWCFNLWLQLSWCFSLLAGRLMGIRAEQKLCPPTFIFTIPSLLTHKKTVYILCQFDRRQSNRLNFAKSCQNSGKLNRGKPETVRNKEKGWKRAAGGSNGGEGSVVGEDEQGFSLHHNKGKPFSFQARRTLNQMQVKILVSNWFSVSFKSWWASQHSWMLRWFGRPINEVPRHGNIKEERLFAKYHTLFLLHYVL